MSYHTKSFRVSQRDILKLLAHTYGKIWIYIAAAGCVISIILGFTLGAKWFIMMLIWICLILPLCLVFLYFYYALLPLNCYNGILHEVTINPTDIVIYKSPEETDNESNKDKVNEKEPLKTLLILNYSEIKVIKVSISNIYLFCENPKGILILPFNSFDSTENINDLLNSIVEKSGQKPVTSLV